MGCKAAGTNRSKRLEMIRIMPGKNRPAQKQIRAMLNAPESVACRARKQRHVILKIPSHFDFAHFHSSRRALDAKNKKMKEHCDCLLEILRSAFAGGNLGLNGNRLC